VVSPSRNVEDGPSSFGERSYSIVICDAQIEGLSPLASSLADYGYATLLYPPDECIRHSVESPDPILLGPNLKVLEVITVCQAIRRESSAPIVVLMPNASDDHYSLVLDAGADHCLLGGAQVSPRVVLSALRAIERRESLARQVGMEIIEAGPLQIDLYHRTVSLHGRPIPLTATEFSILSVLARQSGQVISATDILRQVHGYDAADEEAQDIIKVHMSRLRQKLEADPDAPKCIVTVRGQGYMYMFERRTRSR
jgi:DNA-binding response OmpR family regulator